jgi:DNA-binding CsgD family transcriptional regulator
MRIQSNRSQGLGSGPGLGPGSVSAGVGGGFWSLTPRQKDALRCLIEGLRQDQIARRWGVSIRTVERHLAEARERVGAVTTLQAAVLLDREERSRNGQHTQVG